MVRRMDADAASAGLPGRVGRASVPKAVRGVAAGDEGHADANCGRDDGSHVPGLQGTEAGEPKRVLQVARAGKRQRVSRVHQQAVDGQNVCEARGSQSERDILTAIRIALGDDPDVVLWRNNVGQATASTGHTVRYGLAVGSGDLIGMVRAGPWQPARFLSLEVKTATGRVRPEQQRWRDLVIARGGVAAVVRSVEDARSVVAQAKRGEL